MFCHKKILCWTMIQLMNNYFFDSYKLSNYATHTFGLKLIVKWLSDKWLVLAFNNNYKYNYNYFIITMFCNIMVITYWSELLSLRRIIRWFGFFLVFCFAKPKHNNETILTLEK